MNAACNWDIDLENGKRHAGDLSIRNGRGRRQEVKACIFSMVFREVEHGVLRCATSVVSNATTFASL